MDSTSFDRLTRLFAAARSRRALGGSLLGAVAALLGRSEAEAAPCPRGKKRCGTACIRKAACCLRTHKRCGRRCIGKAACCLVTHKRCGTACIRKAVCCTTTEKACEAGCIPLAACCTETHKLCGSACIPKAQCCTTADCNPAGGGPPNLRICAEGQCVIGQGTCAPLADSCITDSGFCGLVGQGCFCFQSKNPERTRCGSSNSLGGVCSNCQSDADCAASWPNVPGVFCAYAGPRCACNGPSEDFCVAPCPG